MSKQLVSVSVVLIAAAMLCLPAATTVQATEYTWSNGLNSRVWDGLFMGFYGNWLVPNLTPPPDSTAPALLPGAADPTIFSSSDAAVTGDVNLNADREVGTVSFRNSSGA